MLGPQNPPQILLTLIPCLSFFYAFDHNISVRHPPPTAAAGPTRSRLIVGLDKLLWAVEAHRGFFILPFSITLLLFKIKGNIYFPEA